MSVTYTDPKLVLDKRTTEPRAFRGSATGYGPKIPTDYLIKYEGRWRRVYVMVYSNSGSAYIIVNGAEVFLDSETEHALEEVRVACAE